MSPPLVRHFMDRDGVVELECLGGACQSQLMARGVIQQGIIGKENQAGPALGISPDGLLRHRDRLKGKLAIVVFEKLEGLKAGGCRVLGVRRGAETTSRNAQLTIQIPGSVDAL